MKKLFILTLITVLSLSILTACNNQSINEQTNTYQYEITRIIDNEIHGIPLNNISDSNKGILLFKDELSFNATPGDKIEVVWGEEEDIFQSITKIN